MEQVHLTIDGQDVKVSADSTILEAAQSIGIEIPTLCHHPLLQPYNSCLLCVVDVEGLPRPMLSCGTQVRGEMVVTTDNARIRENRRMALELLLSEHCGDCFGACRVTCPANCDIPTFIQRIAGQDYIDAVRIIKGDIPLPVALGCVCPAPCEDECRRERVEEPVAICALKRFAGEQDLESGHPYMPPVAPDTGKKVVIVGAGPAGLSAAYYLRQKGHAVMILEAQEEPGGMLRWGIPAYRLPHEKLAAEIKAIIDLGIETRYNTRLGSDVTLAELREAYDAVFLGIGAQLSYKMKIPGEESQRVWGGIEFLARTARDELVGVGKRVVVIGGGNTAVDAVRTSVRLGAEQVTLVYRRSRQEMPALDVEVKAAEEEGVELHFLAAPVSIEETADGLQVTNVRMELGPPDASGRRRPVVIEGSEFVVACDTLIMAVGQAVDSSGLEGSDIELTRWGSIAVDETTLQTSLPGVFAGGDGVTGPDIAVRAVAAGKDAAASIDQYLRGDQVAGPKAIWSATMGAKDEVPQARFACVQAAYRTGMPELEAYERCTSFAEVELGFTEELALSEAERCLECGCTSVDNCRLRDYAIEYNADPYRFGGKKRDYVFDDSHPALTFEPGKCILCGLCVRMCRDVKGLNVMTFASRGFEAVVTPYFGLPLGETVCDGCLKCVEVCPTGALMAREDVEVEALALAEAVEA